jgi:hypothetical protein
MKLSDQRWLANRTKAYTYLNALLERFLTKKHVAKGTSSRINNPSNALRASRPPCTTAIPQATNSPRNGAKALWSSVGCDTTATLTTLLHEGLNRTGNLGGLIP